MQSEQLLIADSVKFRVLTRTEKANYSTHTKKKIIDCLDSLSHMHLKSIYNNTSSHSQEYGRAMLLLMDMTRPTLLQISPF